MLFLELIFPIASKWAAVLCNSPKVQSRQWSQHTSRALEQGLRGREEPGEMLWRCWGGERWWGSSWHCADELDELCGFLCVCLQTFNLRMNFGSCYFSLQQVSWRALTAGCDVTQFLCFWCLGYFLVSLCRILPSVFTIVKFKCKAFLVHLQDLICQKMWNWECHTHRNVRL